MLKRENIFKVCLGLFYYLLVYGTVFKVVSPEGYNASIEVISYKLPCL